MRITKGHSILPHSRSSIPRAFGNYPLFIIKYILPEYLAAGRQVGKIKTAQKNYALFSAPGKFMNRVS